MREQLIKLRKAMAEHNIDWYVIPSGDFHSSEYVGSFFKCRAYVSGFTGSAGTLLVGKDWAGLWTDGRYFLQAAAQLENSGIELMKMGEPGVPTLLSFIKSNFAEGETLGFDGRVIDVKLYNSLRDAAGLGSVNGEFDLVGEIWDNRPEMSHEPVFELPESLVGESRSEKLTKLRSVMDEKGADAFLLSSLDDIAWLLNIRGGDVACTPVVLSFFGMTKKGSLLFVNPSTLSDEIRSNLEKDGVAVRGYNEVYDWVKSITEGKLMMNLGVVNSAIFSSVRNGVEIIDCENPTKLPKAIKNPVEVENIRKAHVKDGVAMTKLMYWLKKNAGKIPMDELSVADKVEEFRSQQENYMGPSFSPIIAYGPHGAIVHYSATEESNVKIEPRSFLLADTGGQYLEGTTDITRTFAMGPLTEKEKQFYTLVLKGNLHLGNARFRYGCTGMNLDYVAHQPLWDMDMDYNHGTGHGVGYLLNVHEGPQSIRWRDSGAPAAVLEAGMVTSDEPGVYLEGEFGIRLENLTVVVEGATNSYGKFMHFDYLTMVPFDLDAIVPEMMNEDEKRMLNAYHAQVRDTLLPLLGDEEGKWLCEATRAI